MARITVVAFELRGFAPVGGMGTATTFLALALARMGHDVEVLLGVQHRPEAVDPYWRRVYEDAGIAIRGAPTPDDRIVPWPFFRARSIDLGLRERRGDVVIAHEFGAPAYTALRMKDAGLAFDDTLFVVFCHGSRRYALDLSRDLAPEDLVDVLGIGVLEQACVELADVAVSPSAYLLDWMRDVGWRLPERSLVIPYFARADATNEPRVVADRAPRATLERLAFFGRVDERKGLKLFLSALNRLEPSLLAGIDLEFIGRTTPTWPRERVEASLSATTKRALRRIVFEGELDQHDALARLRRPGTLVVMPSLSETFSNTVYECLENAIPFIASNVGGVPELVASDDHARVLFDATPTGLEAALRRTLSERRVPEPARPAFDTRLPFERWEEVLRLRPQPRTAPVGDDRVDVVIVGGSSAAEDVERCRAALSRQTHTAFEIAAAGREPAVGAGTAPYVVFLDGGDVPEPQLLETLVRAQKASGADAVTSGIRFGDGVELFPGDPGGLGVVANGYGAAPLFRRDALRRVTLPQSTSHGREWPRLASYVAAGVQVVSLPLPLVARRGRADTVHDAPEDALLAAQQLERTLPESASGLARLAAGLAADAADDPARRRRRRLGVAAAVVVLTLLGAALRFATLGRQSYWYDELVTVSVLHRGFGAMLRAIPHTEATPYAYYVLAWPWSRLFGLGEAGLRSLSALAGTVTVPVAYAAGAAVASRRAGVVAAALVAVNPFLIWYSQEARSYALFALFAAVTVLFAARTSVVWWALAAAAAVATHYFAVFVVAVEALWLLSRRGWRAVAAAALPLAVLVAEIPLVLEQRDNGGNIGASPLLHRVAGIPKDLMVGYSFPAELAGTLVAGALVAVGVVLAFRTTNAVRRGASIAAGIAAFTIVAPVVLAIAGHDYVIARNAIAAVVPAAIVLAVGYAARPAGVVAAAALCALSLAVAVAVAADKRYERTDWRGAVRALPQATGARAIVATPTIEAALLRPYIAVEPAPASARVSEIDVLALASQGGFTTGAVHPPDTPLRAAPPGFRVVSTKRTSTYTLVRYDASHPLRVTAAELGGLGLSTVPATVLLQRPTSDGRR